MAGSRSLQDLLSVLTQSCEQITAHLHSNNEQAPSLALGSAPAIGLPPQIDQVRQSALDACDELRAVLQGPVPHLMSLVTKVSNICFFGVSWGLSGLLTTGSIATSPVCRRFASLALPRS